MLGFNSDKDAVGKSIMMFNKQWDIVGVINNYHQKSLRYRIRAPNTSTILSIQAIRFL